MWGNVCIIGLLLTRTKYYNIKRKKVNKIYVAVHGLKLEIGNLGDLSACGHAQAGMKRVCDFDVYKVAKALEKKFYLSQTRQNTKQ